MFFTLFFTLFFMYEFEYDLFNQKKPQFIISCLNSLKTMNSGARRKVLANTSYQISCMNSWEMYELIYI